jgi:hypothetical protein
VALLTLTTLAALIAALSPGASVVAYAVGAEQAAPPSAPQNLTGVVSGNAVMLNWLPPATGPVTGYVIEVSFTTFGPFRPVVSVPTNFLVASGVSPGLYFVRVRAVNLDGMSPPSNGVILSVPSADPGCGFPPGAPVGFTASVTGSLVTLNWGPGGGFCLPTHYVVLAGSASGASDLAQVTTAATSLSANAPPGTYYIRIVAVNRVGMGGSSNEIAVTVPR